MLKFPLPHGVKVQKFDIMSKTDWRIYEAFVQDPGYTIIREETYSLPPVLLPNLEEGEDKELLTAHQVVKIVTYLDRYSPKRKVI